MDLAEDYGIPLKHSAQWEAQECDEMWGWAEVWGYSDFLRLCRMHSASCPASHLLPLANEEKHMLLIPVPALTSRLSKIPEQTGFLLGIYTY